MMNKMTKKINQKINNLKKNFLEMTYNFNAYMPTFKSQKMNELKQTLNIKMTTICIKNDVDKKNVY